MWWTDAPAILKGWFDRVWTVGWAYHPSRPRPAKKALVLCSAGHTVEHLRETGLLQSMEAVMLVDRIFDRAAAKDFRLFGGSEVLVAEEWAQVRHHHLEEARTLGREIDM
ncbi:MAG: NAD(P)H-dependent oxidoreductase [Propionibacteriaceae bacterium]|nr:NAD(P)H-dependent oxidoreductase [Propionibacteriaceae bacterium]